MARTALRRLPLHGWLGLALVAVVWPLNWSLTGLRTHLCFFPLWLGYCLAIDGFNVALRGTSLLRRSPRLYFGLFVISVPLWWIFEAINQRMQNWRYLGVEAFSDLEYALLASLSFSTVIPAVLGSAEAVAGARFFRCRSSSAAARPGRCTARVYALVGVSMFALMMAWPRLFFPLVWLSLYFAVEAINIRSGYRSLAEYLLAGNWRPVFALWLGVLLCGFFWEMWNIDSYPKWVYDVPFFGFWHVFEMPLLGYLGYLPFSMEIFAFVHLALGLAGYPRADFVTRGLIRDP